MNVRGTLSRTEIERFLSASAIPIRLACRTPGGSLWMLSLWFRHRDGSIECATSADADVVQYLREDPSLAFEVSTNEPPYRGVRGNGTASIESDPDKTVLEALLERYLGGIETPLAKTLLAEDREEVTITIEPETVYGWDYSDRMLRET